MPPETIDRAELSSVGIIAVTLSCALAPSLVCPYNARRRKSDAPACGRPEDMIDAGGTSRPTTRSHA
jgi:hypothetical protein